MKSCPAFAIRLFITAVIGTMAIDLPSSMAQDSAESKPRSLNDPLTAEEQETPLDEYVSPSTTAKDAFAPPPGAKELSKRNVWIDRAKGRVYADGYVALKDGALEMFACPTGTKEHESIVGVLGRASEIHAALLAVGARKGTPVDYDTEFRPATGQRIRVWVCYRDDQRKFHVSDARRWVKKTGTKEQLSYDWVFAGSGFWKDPTTGRDHYLADSGDLICVSNFRSAMLDLPVASSAEVNRLQFSPFTERIPKPYTPVRLVLVPIPIPSDKPDAETEKGNAPKIDASQPPKEDILPLKQ